MGGCNVENHVEGSSDSEMEEAEVVEKPCMCEEEEEEEEEGFVLLSSMEEELKVSLLKLESKIADERILLTKEAHQRREVNESEHLGMDMMIRIIRLTRALVESAGNGLAHRTFDRLMRYRPGLWISDNGGRAQSEYAIPEATTLLVVGLKGAGKSSLVNQIVFALSDESSTGFHRAQVCEDQPENGTYFMKELMICHNNISIFDSRGLPEFDTVEALSMLESWMTEGVEDSQLVPRMSDTSFVRNSLKIQGKHCDEKKSRKKDVNYVIFVVSAVSILKMQASKDTELQTHLVQLYKSSFLTFRDDRPVVVMTHGDLLSIEDRISARLFLGRIFGVPADYQIYDVPGKRVYASDEDSLADITTLYMLEFALEQADCNLPYKMSWSTYLNHAYMKARPMIESAHNIVSMNSGSSHWTLVGPCLIMIYYACVWFSVVLVRLVSQAKLSLT